MRILIIEDERPAANRIKKLINELAPGATIIDCFETITDSVAWLKNNSAPDLIISDIELADGQSFEIYNQVEIESPIIFTTAYDQYAIKAFKLNSIDYLLKPIEPEELERAIEKFKNLSKASSVDIKMLQSMINAKQEHFKERFMVKIGEKILSIPTETIAFIYSEQKATFIQTIDKRKFLIDYTLDQLSSSLDPKSFFRLNRKYITKHEAIETIISYSNSRLKVNLKDCNDQDIIVSREKVAALKEWLDE